jgi:hypothetical protein
MAFEKVERYRCDMPGCEQTSERGGKFWTVVTVNQGDTERDGSPSTRHVCPNHDATGLGQILVNARADSKRFERPKAT